MVRVLALHFDIQSHFEWDGLFVEGCGAPAELLDRFNDTCVQSRVDRLDDLNILGLALLVDGEFEDNLSVVRNRQGEVGGELDACGVYEVGFGNTGAYRAGQG